MLILKENKNSKFRFKLINENSKNLPMNLDKDTLYDLYITQQKTSREVGDILGCTSKTVRNYLAKYGIPIRPHGEAIKLERSKWDDEKELQRARNVHKAWAKKTPEEIKAINDKKLASGNINSPASIAKAYQTKLNNGTSLESKSENDFYNKLLILGYDKDDVKRHYFKDSRYPYDCDFYIVSQDLFIEYQGHQTHGNEPFDKNNRTHLDLLQQYSNSGYDMSTWTTRDPKKLQTAINSKINLLLIYPKHKTYLVKDGKITTIDINDINKI